MLVLNLDIIVFGNLPHIAHHKYDLLDTFFCKIHFAISFPLVLHQILQQFGLIHIIIRLVVSIDHLNYVIFNEIIHVFKI